MLFDSHLMSQASSTISSTSNDRPSRHCNRCEQDKSASEFPTINGNICTDCKTKKRREKEAKRNAGKSSKYPALHAWREAWPHLKTCQ